MMLHFLTDVANDSESTQNDHYVTFASLKSKLTWYADKQNTRFVSIDTRLGFENPC